MKIITLQSKLFSPQRVADPRREERKEPQRKSGKVASLRVTQRPPRLIFCAVPGIRNPKLRIARLPFTICPVPKSSVIRLSNNCDSAGAACCAPTKKGILGDCTCTARRARTFYIRPSNTFIVSFDFRLVTFAYSMP
ncbi:MAG: hypothetical protein C4532_17650 [Candidatus Abyssobacteria bacterium SURF_17]|uniref:Uncharacterized protein n=1 Tax=Candidatus Abyssobacteria bacterium SURF_17 TaxID=2093361 RepID=A0A419EQN3_9BACT|nr:MAG: hypothetical protein C4532_17650 [Candidatus Abyssubacteria bacterium SURF_17]